MNQHGHILVTGRDAALLSTRAQVLASAQYRVSTSLQPLASSESLEDVQLLIVCHTLSATERQDDIATFAASVPKAKALCLIPHAGSSTDGAAILDSFCGPREMLRVVHRLLTA